MAHLSGPRAVSNTIVAVITPPGEGGIAAIRIAGPGSLRLSKIHFKPESKSRKSDSKPFMMRLGHFVDRQGVIIDEVMIVFMPEGKSYTGAEQIEIFCHGGMKITQRILETLISSGGRAAEPGEYTKMAFLSGRISLDRAEAVAEVISANSDYSLKTAREHLVGDYGKLIESLRHEIIDIYAEIEASLDFPEEEIPPETKRGMLQNIDGVLSTVRGLAESYASGRIARDGFTIAIAGKPNSGKSSLFNYFLKKERAIVTPIPGTTRDYLQEWFELGGYAVCLIDTAGLRSGGGTVEKAGQKSARKIIDSADLVLWLIDLTDRSWMASLPDSSRNLLVGNKIDIVSKSSLKALRARKMLGISCLTGKGMSSLRRMILNLIEETMPDKTSGVVVTSARHRQKLAKAGKFLRAARRQIESEESPELVAFELKEAILAMDEITGKVYTEELLDRIFSRFCIGK